LTFLGPAVGPIAGGFIAQYSTWRWVFWSVSCVDAGVQIMALIFLQETYKPIILHRIAKKMRNDTGNQSLHTEWETPDHTLPKLLRRRLVVPFIMLFTQPVVQVVAIYRAYLYGIMYLVLASFPSVWEDVYDFSVSIASLNYISLGLGFIAGIQFCAPVSDRVSHFHRTKHSRSLDSRILLIVILIQNSECLSSIEIIV
jgi:MFS family permease